MATPASPISALTSAKSLCAASREEMEPSKHVDDKGMLEIRSGSREQDCRGQAEHRSSKKPHMCRGDTTSPGCTEKQTAFANHREHQESSNPIKNNAHFCRVDSRVRRKILPICSAQMRPHLQSCLQSWGPAQEGHGATRASPEEAKEMLQGLKPLHDLRGPSSA